MALSIGANGIRLGCSVKREASLLLCKAIESLTLAVELFNRPSDLGRTHSTLIILDHAFEMLLKAGILHKRGKIRDAGEKYSIGFAKCVNRALTSEGVKFLTPEEALTLQAINSQRDAAQHHYVDISEQQLYLLIQSGVTLFCDLMERVFQTQPCAFLPSRVLPISTEAPTSIEALFIRETERVRDLLRPGARRKQEALAAIRPLALLDRAISGDDSQPSESELRAIATRIQGGETWSDLFRGVAQVEVVSEGNGPTLTLRFSKKQGIEIRQVEGNDPDASAVGVVYERELDKYNLSTTQMSKHLDITMPRFLALSRYLQLEDDPECYRLIKVGNSSFKRFSRAALLRAREAKETLSSEEWDRIWEEYRPRPQNRIAA